MFQEIYHKTSNYWTLPCRKKQKRISLPENLKNHSPQTDTPNLTYMETGTILIVDDNKSVLASLELLLENEFSTVRTAHHHFH